MKTAVITGANRGIGKEIARQLAHRSFQIVLTARDLHKAEQTAQEIGGHIIPMQLDVTDDQSAKAFGKAIAEQVGQVDAGHRDHRNQRVGQDMFGHDFAVFQAFGTGLVGALSYGVCCTVFT